MRKLIGAIQKAVKDETGATNANMIAIALGLVLIAVAFIIFPIVLEGAEEVRLATNVSQYTGLDSMVKIGPTLVFVGLLFGGVVATFFGVKGYAKGK